MMQAGLLSAALLATCTSAAVLDGPLARATWGGDGVGVIVTDSTMHVHIGCTVGDSPRPSVSAGRFEVTGTYDVNAYPVSRGIMHPAVFRGEVTDRKLTLTVTLTDTSVVLGPVTAELGRDPNMGPCPICRVPGDRMAATRKSLRGQPGSAGN